MSRSKANIAPRFLIIALLPLLLNIVITPMFIVLLVSMQEFMEKPFYYTYTYGPLLWSMYHVLLALLLRHFLKCEGQSIKLITGSTEISLNSIVLIFGLILFSFLIFQILEPMASNLIYGPGMMKQLLSEYKRVPISIIVYTIVVTSLTAGVCEELIWRGYLQTRLENRFIGRSWVAVTIQAMLFGLWHGPSLHAVFTGLSGFIYGLIYTKTRKLLPIMISHWLGGVLGFSYMYFAMV
ncbi:MAG: CPBP family intramembrane glutamic endopeptidase [Thermoproteota archaeon]